MSRNVSDDFKQAVFSPQTDKVFIFLVTISNAQLSDDIRVASDPYEVLPVAGVRGVVHDGEEYIYIPFEFTFPNDDPTTFSTAKIVIDNVGRDYIAQIRQARGDITINVKLVLSSDVQHVETTLPSYQLRNISYNALSIQGDIVKAFFENEPFPSGRYVPSKYTGLF